MITLELVIDFIRIDKWLYWNWLIIILELTCCQLYWNFSYYAFLFRYSFSTHSTSFYTNCTLSIFSEQVFQYQISTTTTTTSGGYHPHSTTNHNPTHHLLPSARQCSGPTQHVQNRSGIMLLKMISNNNHSHYYQFVVDCYVNIKSIVPIWISCVT